jgi:hypothetical protein
MSRANIAYPFQRIVDESIQAGAWEILVEGEYIPLGSEIEHWDYDTQINLRRQLSFELLQILAEGRLREDACLRVAVLCTTGRGAVRRVVWSRELDRRSIPVNITLSIPGNDLQGDLLLDTQLTLSSPGKRPLSLGATLTGSRLWGDSFSVLLEGQQGRLPMAVVDLQLANPMYGLAPWYIDWSDASLEASFLGRVQLLLNSRRGDVLEKLNEGDPMLIGLAAADVARQILRSLITDPVCEFAGDPEAYPPGSLGAVASDWFQSCFPEYAVEEVRTMIGVDPAGFDASVQSGFAPDQP